MATADFILAYDPDKQGESLSTERDSSDGVSLQTSEEVNWWVLVDQIKAGDPEGMAELYRIFSRGVRFYLCRQLGPQELEDKVHDTFLIVVQAIQRGELREPDRLMGFVRTVVRRQVASHIDQVVHSRRDQVDLESGVTLVDRRRNPEEKAIGKETANLMMKILRSLSQRDREILTRFYLHEEPQDKICEEMHLTDTQFRLLKSRAKARFGAVGRRKTQGKTTTRNFLRIMVGKVH